MKVLASVLGVDLNVTNVKLFGDPLEATFGIINVKIYK